MPKYKLRGEVRKRWKEKGCPKWNYEQTESVCLDVNHYLEKKGQNPTPRFHEEIGNKNKKYIRQWVFGCHFEWLNPRPNKTYK